MRCGAVRCQWFGGALLFFRVLSGQAPAPRASPQGRPAPAPLRLCTPGQGPSPAAGEHPDAQKHARGLFRRRFEETVVIGSKLTHSLFWKDTVRFRSRWKYSKGPEMVCSVFIKGFDGSAAHRSERCERLAPLARGHSGVVGRRGQSAVVEVREEVRCPRRRVAKDEAPLAGSEPVGGGARGGDTAQ